MKITALDLLDLGIIDEVINEPLGGAQKMKKYKLYQLRKCSLNI